MADLGAVTMSAAPVIGVVLGDTPQDLGAVTVGATVATSVDVANNALALVTISAGVHITPTLTLSINLGTVVVGAAPTLTTVVPQPGTLANPYAASDTDTRTLDFTTALFVPAEPIPLTGPLAAPSVWYEFTESQTADWLASTSGFASGATIEIYSGPHGATAADLTFAGADGILATDLGSVAISAAATVVVDPLTGELVNLGVVTMSATAVTAVALT